MTKYVQDSSAAKSLSAYVIMKGKRHVATVQAHYTQSRCLVNIRQDDTGNRACQKLAGDSADYYFQSGSAYGYGYDKFTAALRGLIIDGHELTDHCGRNRKPPRGLRLWPRGGKAPKGYQFANYVEIDRATGKRIDRQQLRIDGWQQLGDSADESAVRQYMADELAKLDIESGYADCFRESGLDYLKAIGYSVILAI